MFGDCSSSLGREFAEIPEKFDHSWVVIGGSLTFVLYNTYDWAGTKPF